MFSIVRIYCCCTRDMYLGLAPPCGTATREATFPTFMSKPVRLTKRVSANAVRGTISTVIVIATTRTTTAITVMTILTTMAIGIS